MRVRLQQDKAFLRGPNSLLEQDDDTGMVIAKGTELSELDCEHLCVNPN